MEPIVIVAVSGTVVGVSTLLLFWWSTTDRADRFFKKMDEKLLNHLKKSDKSDS